MQYNIGQLIQQGGIRLSASQLKPRNFVTKACLMNCATKDQNKTKGISDIFQDLG